MFEMAVGLERMSPLGIVAAVGLTIGTFLTVILIPVIYLSLEDLKGAIGRFFRFLFGLNPAGAAEVPARE